VTGLNVVNRQSNGSFVSELPTVRIWFSRTPVSTVAAAETISDAATAIRKRCPRQKASVFVSNNESDLGDSPAVWTTLALRIFTLIEDSFADVETQMAVRKCSTTQ
jgi:hypothetical protein